MISAGRMRVVLWRRRQPLKSALRITASISRRLGWSIHRREPVVAHRSGCGDRTVKAPLEELDSFPRSVRAIRAQRLAKFLAIGTCVPDRSPSCSFTDADRG